MEKQYIKFLYPLGVGNALGLMEASGGNTSVLIVILEFIILILVKEA